MFLTSDTSEPLTPLERDLGVKVLHELKRHYPAVAPGWDVAINNGVLYIRNTLLAGRMGCCLHTAKIDPEMKKVMRAGGQLLERYRIARDKALSEASVLHSIETAPRAANGEMIPEA